MAALHVEGDDPRAPGNGAQGALGLLLHSLARRARGCATPQGDFHQLESAVAPQSPGVFPEAFLHPLWLAGPGGDQHDAHVGRSDIPKSAASVS